MASEPAPDIAWLTPNWWAPHAAFPFSVKPMRAAPRRFAMLWHGLQSASLTPAEADVLAAWCADTFGPPAATSHERAGCRWWWDREYHRFCFADEADLAMFRLRFSGPAPRA